VQERAQLIRHKDGNVELFHRRMATLIKKGRIYRIARYVSQI
jgi:hypothetical protein